MCVIAAFAFVNFDGWAVSVDVELNEKKCECILLDFCAAALWTGIFGLFCQMSQEAKMGFKVICAQAKAIQQTRWLKECKQFAYEY